MKLLNPDFDFSAYFARIQGLVNGHLESIFLGFDGKRELIRAIRHSLMSGGKRMRPVLAIAAAQACGADASVALPVACAIEMIHTYSLIHDDLPAMDDDDLRRGQPTCHKKFSQATAILAGDALLTHAFWILSNLEDSHGKSGIGLEDRLVLIQNIAGAAGINGMVEGQMMDMQSMEPVKELSMEEKLSHLKTLQELKTGKMIQVSVESGALISGASREEFAALKQYAEAVGLGFQVMDDILDVEGDAKIMGKTPGSDSSMNKLTFPFLLGLSQSREFAEELTQKALDALSAFDEKAEPLRAIAWYITHRDK